MRIGELAKAVGASTSRIRFYEAEGLLPAPRRRVNGYRDYPDEAALVVGFIERAQQFGFSLKEIGAVLPDPYVHRPSDALLISALKGKLRDVEAHIAAALVLKANIEQLTEQIEARQAAALSHGVLTAALAGVDQNVAN